ncbi:hypothetical protein [Nonomuraea phyllanthi]|uniref:hypothetical protein n=1 Tax=Nonomuraea phyllanthi TaxID=2219224 RepID=UPI001D0155B9|nr:hypothetical protein [Nonomuraea phyllanthi]
MIPDGFRRGDPFNLYDYQLRYFAAFYLVRGDAVWQPEDPVLGPAFVYRRGLLAGPQKLGKGPHTAAHVCVEGVGPALFAGWAGRDDGYACADFGCGCGWEYPYERGEPMGMPWPTPLIQITAVSEEQTDNIYGALRPMIELGPLADLIPKTGEEFIRLPGGGRVDTVTSSAQSRLGQRVTFVPQDEVGLWTTTNKMTRVADTQYRGLAGMGGRASLTTNAWDPSENSVAQQQFESSAQDIYRQFVQPPGHLSYRNKAERRRIHRIVYGEALKENGGHVDLDSIEAEAADLIERDPAQAERFFGNRIVYGAGHFIDGDVWDGRAEPCEVPDGTAIVLGMDGSDVDDWTGIRAETSDGFQFTPTFGPDRRPTVWDPAAYGGQVPRLEVAAAFDELMTRFNVVRAYIDPPGWTSEIDAWAEKYGDKIVIRWATYRPVQMHAACERLHVDVGKADSSFRHDGCPITAIHVRNTRKAPRPGQRYVLAKASQTQKIDLTVCSVLAHEAYGDATAAGLFTVEKPTENLIYTASSTRRR